MPLSFQTASGIPASTVVLRISQALHPDAADMLYAAERQRDRIVRRTGQGTDADGQPFKEYTPAYAKRKAASGRDSGIVDLTWSGLMLKAMRTNRVTPGGFVIGIYGDEGLRGAVHNYGIGTMPVRFFMGANAQDRRSILTDVVARRMARVNGGLLNAA
jgi:hypothetical protein